MLKNTDYTSSAKNVGGQLIKNGSEEKKQFFEIHLKQPTTTFNALNGNFYST